MRVGPPGGLAQRTIVVLLAGGAAAAALRTRRLASRIASQVLAAVCSPCSPICRTEPPPVPGGGRAGAVVILQA